MLSRRVVGRLTPLVRASRLFRPLPTPIRREYALARGPSPNDPFANGTNAYYADEMYRLWRQDPQSVHPSWNVYFSGLEKGLPSHQAFQPPPRDLPHPADGAPALHAGGGAELDDHLKVRFCTLDFLAPSYSGHSGPTPCSRLPSARPSRRRVRPSGYP